MALADIELFSSYPAIFNSLTISDVIDVEPSPNVNEIAERAAGSLDVNARGIANVDPQFTLNCLNLAHLATISPTLGLYVTSTCRVQYQKRSYGGAFAGSGDVHLKFYRAMLLPESVRASQDEASAARLALKAFVLYDGSNPALEFTNDALSGTPGIAAMYKLGPVTIAGNALGGVQSAAVNFGLDFQTTRHAGETVARVGAIYGRAPTFNIETKNLTALAQSGFGQKRLSGNVVIYYRKVAETGTDAVSFTLVNPWIELGNIPGGGNEDPRPGLIIKPDGGGTIAVNTAATLP